MVKCYVKKVFGEGIERLFEYFFYRFIDLQAYDLFDVIGCFGFSCFTWECSFYNRFGCFLVTA